MIITRVPYRVSLFGGGTDFKSFYADRGTIIVSFSIDKYCYLTLKKLLPYFDIKYRISWSHIEEVSCIKDIKHPSVRACLTEYDLHDGFEIHTVGDLPARSGLGSSSSFTAAMLAALTIFKGSNDIDPVLIARQTIRIEQEVLQEAVGIQDQIQVCHGGFNVTNIFPDSTYSIVSLGDTSQFVRQVNASLVLVYSGIVRHSSEIHKAAISKTDTQRRNQNLERIREYSEEFSRKLLDHTITFSEFASLLNQSWSSKVHNLPQSAVNLQLLSIYDQAIDAGADCGKLLGAGGGGFFAFFVQPHKQQEFMKLMSPYLSIRAKVSTAGVQQVI